MPLNCGHFERHEKWPLLTEENFQISLLKWNDFPVLNLKQWIWPINLPSDWVLFLCKPWQRRESFGMLVFPYIPLNYVVL